MHELKGKPIKIVRVGFGTLNSFIKLAVYFYTAGCLRLARDATINGYKIIMG